MPMKRHGPAPVTSVEAVADEVADGGAGAVEEVEIVVLSPGQLQGGGHGFVAPAEVAPAGWNNRCNVRASGTKASTLAVVERFALLWSTNEPLSEVRTNAGSTAVQS